MNTTVLKIATATVALVFAWGCSSPEVPHDDPPAEQPDELVGDEDQLPDDDPAQHAEDDEESGVLHMVAVAEMHSGEGEPMGQVMFTQTEEGVEVHGRIETLDESLKGFHVHEFGECDPPEFESAGGHFNPGGHPHGAPDAPPEQRHAGDFGNLEFNEEGVAEFTFVDDVITLGAGTNDIVGKALIVHYEEDDLQTQPTGDAGPRAGCGIIEAAGAD